MASRAYNDYFPDPEWKYEPDPDPGSGYEPEYSEPINSSWMDNYVLPSYIVYGRLRTASTRKQAERPRRLSLIRGGLAVAVSSGSRNSTVNKLRAAKALRPLLQFPSPAASVVPMPLARPGLPRPMSGSASSELDIRASITYGLQCLDNAAHLLDDEHRRYAVEPCEIERYVQRLNKSFRSYKKKFRQRMERD